MGDNITISGADKYTDFIVANASTSEPVTLEGLTIANGDGVGSAGAAGTSSSPGGNGGDAAGGVMLSSGSLDLFDDAFNNDTATGGAGGAAWSPETWQNRAKRPETAATRPAPSMSRRARRSGFQPGVQQRHRGPGSGWRRGPCRSRRIRGRGVQHHE